MDIRKYHSQKEMFSKQYGCRGRTKIRRAMKTVEVDRDHQKGFLHQLLNLFGFPHIVK